MQQEYFLMETLRQQYLDIEEMPIYEAEIFIDLKIADLKDPPGSK